MAKTRTRKTSARRRRALTAGGHSPTTVTKGDRQVHTADLNALARFYWWADRNRIELAPPAVAAALFATSAVFYKSGLPSVGLLSGVAVGGLAWGLAPKALDREAEVLYARAVGLAAALYLIVACVLGPAHPVVFWLWLVASAAAAAVWYRHKLSRPTMPSPIMLEWVEKWEGIRERLGLAGSVVVAVKGDHDFAEITIQLKDHTYQDVKDMGERIAGALGLPARAIKVRDRRKIDASTFTLVYTRVSTIDHLIGWQDAAVLTPTTLSKPGVLGRNEVGEWKTADLRGHWMIVGMSRAGKSNELHALLANITGTYDPAGQDPAEALVFFVDLKSGAVGGRWSECVDWLATTMDEAVTLFTAVNGMIEARGEHAPVGEGDGDQLEPSPELPAIYVVFDECAEGLGVTPGSPNQAIKTAITGLVESIARRGAALAIYLILCGQDGSLETYGTEKLRGNLMKRLCFRVAKNSNAQYVLDDYATLDVTGLEKGQFYYHEAADDPVPIRGPFMTPEDARRLPQEIAARNAARRPVLDAATAAGGGEAYATRHDRLPAKYRKTTHTGSKVPAEPQEEPMHQQTPMPGSAAARAAEAEAEAGLTAGAPPITPEHLRQASEATGFDLAKDLKDATDTFCSILASGPVTGVRAKDLYTMVGVGKQWMYDRLNMLAPLGLVENISRGQWRACPGVRAADLREAIEAWEAERKELAGAGV